jgi:hypothetical protein
MPQNSSFFCSPTALIVKAIYRLENADLRAKMADKTTLDSISSLLEIGLFIPHCRRNTR